MEIATILGTSTKATSAWSIPLVSKIMTEATTNSDHETTDSDYEMNEALGYKVYVGPDYDPFTFEEEHPWIDFADFDPDLKGLHL